MFLEKPLYRFCTCTWYGNNKFGYGDKVWGKFVKMKIPETPFEFINIVIKEYSKFKNISEDDVIDSFNKYGIF